MKPMTPEMIDLLTRLAERPLYAGSGRGPGVIPSGRLAGLDKRGLVRREFPGGRWFITDAGRATLSSTGAA